MYFTNFPKVAYDVRGTNIPQLMTDITRRVAMTVNTKKNLQLLDYYDVRDGETPEYIADKYYGNVELHWLILITNDIVDYYSQWPLGVNAFEEFVYNKYENVDAIHHYEVYQESGDTTKLIELPNESATSIPVDAIAITNYEYEEALNNDRRRIRLIKREYAPQIIKEFEAKIRGL